MIFGRKPIGTLAGMFGVPAVLTTFCKAWGQLIAYSNYFACDPNTEYIHLDYADFSFHSWARNQLAERMLGEFILMLDTDHEPEPDTLVRMWDRMQMHDLDVLCGVYQFKKEPYPPVIFGEDDKGQFQLLGAWDEALPLQTVSAAGGGCLMVRRRVFNRIREELNEQPFDVIGQSGEDMAFFTRLKKLGIKPYMDARIECPHLVTRSITLKDYRKPKVEPIRLKDAQGIV